MRIKLVDDARKAWKWISVQAMVAAKEANTNLVSHLVSNGIEAGRITTISYGKERPVCAEHNEACWSKNRNDTFLTKER